MSLLLVLVMSAGDIKKTSHITKDRVKNITIFFMPTDKWHFAEEAVLEGLLKTRVRLINRAEA
ncbi:MAG: hypothetical protein ACJARL_002543 [Halopseudomonas sp.]|jgi:hypothetical protein